MVSGELTWKLGFWYMWQVLRQRVQFVFCEDSDRAWMATLSLKG